MIRVQSWDSILKLTYLAVEPQERAPRLAG